MACELRHSRERLKQWVQEGPLVGRMAYWWNFILLKRSCEIPKWSLTFVEAFVVIQLELVYHMSVSQVRIQIGSTLRKLEQFGHHLFQPFGGLLHLQEHGTKRRAKSAAERVQGSAAVLELKVAKQCQDLQRLEAKNLWVGWVPRGLTGLTRGE